MADIKIHCSRTTTCLPLSIVAHQPINRLDVGDRTRSLITYSTNSTMYSSAPSHNAKVSKLGRCINLLLDTIPSVRKEASDWHCFWGFTFPLILVCPIRILPNTDSFNPITFYCVRKYRAAVEKPMLAGCIVNELSQLFIAVAKAISCTGNSLLNTFGSILCIILLR
ncbi:MAG: hypothetical protein [Podoviridae sp. ctbj_2]|nr:MAG: hypothetical protein [Podoviridae sp. ctbj_2]